MKKKQPYRLDLTLFVGRSLLEGDDLDVLERTLGVIASSWSTDLHVWQHDKKKRNLVGGFAEGLRAVASERGVAFQKLTQNHGAGRYERITGSAELRGNDSSLVVIVGMDEYTFAPSAGRYLWGNSITFQFSRSTFNGEHASLVASTIADQCCEHMNVPYAHGQLQEEWDAKNMATDGSTMAIGVDISRYLPGLYWLNFFGKTYSHLIGRDRLLKAPAHQSGALGDGIMMLVDEKPETWNKDNSNYSDVLNYIGDAYFFMRDKLDRQTRAPDYGLAQLPRHPRFS
jgi:hypothetical protein